ncbi:hypothetical protein MGYG_02669 [Nannizzia gypsea CBS 118893]|uniref:Uncharacterized protein n=1 Tax=Arthroderma gypseum (strain ATCC MYA-4604 / CBS 118893) TaxID=535722 RepID=E4UNQ3_ARTGP|nr:hypothetical protein MGYG_02669 [Nannizzia gypsea CBS 118893]EFQ99656.1 hypothetical protein MGYG_02669 [Nannizzia gypsea CBS 118893]
MEEGSMGELEMQPCQARHRLSLANILWMLKFEKVFRLWAADKLSPCIKMVESNPRQKGRSKAVSEQAPSLPFQQDDPLPPLENILPCPAPNWVA